MKKHGWVLYFLTAGVGDNYTNSMLPLIDILLWIFFKLGGSYGKSYVYIFY